MPLFDIHTPALLIKIRNITAPAALVMVRLIPETSAYSGYNVFWFLEPPKHWDIFEKSWPISLSFDFGILPTHVPSI